MGRNTSKDSEPQKPLTAKQKRELRAREAAEATAAGKPTSEQIQQTNAAAIARPDQIPAAAGQIETPKRSGEQVVVGCKIGVAYIDLQLQKPNRVWENTQTGPREITIYQKTGNVVRIRGTAYPRGTPPEGFPERPVMVEGAALTFGVDKEFWDEWVKQNHLNPIVMNGMVFAHKNIDQVRGIAKETAANKSGLEPINPKGDKRMPKSTRSDVSNIETEETRAEKMNRLASEAGG